MVASHWQQHLDEGATETGPNGDMISAAAEVVTNNCNLTSDVRSAEGNIVGCNVKRNILIATTVSITLSGIQLPKLI